MSAEIIPFDFEEQAVRVVTRDGEPWFVAADVCRVLEIANRADAVGRLDDDERDAVGITDTIGRDQKMSIISESGLYALVLTSRKDAARRFRKWITAEVLPAIRRHGRYEGAPDAAPAPMPNSARDLDGMTPRDWLALVREARILGGARAGRRMWSLSPLPQLDAGPVAPSGLDARAALSALLARDVEGAPLADWIEAARGGDLDAARALSQAGFRLVDGGLFVANFATGADRAALLALPGAGLADTTRTLAGHTARGIVLPLGV